MNFAATLIIGILLALFPANAKDFRDNKPSAEKQQYCQKMMRNFGRWSVNFNSDWYGKGVMRPKSNGWEWSHSKEPGFFSDELFYIYKQETADGFNHQGYCKWREDGYLEVYINHFDYGGVVVCDSWGDSETRCN